MNADQDILIDVHTHVVPESFPAYAGRHVDARWPAMAAAAEPCHRHVMVAGSVYRTVSHHCWDCRVRSADMAARSVGRQVLSVMPELLSYWLQPEDGATLCRYMNEVIARMTADHPAHFIGLGTVPLQDVTRAIAELDYAVHELGLRGVEIGTNVNGTPIGHPGLLPFFEAAAEWDASIFVHALRPAGMDRLVGPPTLEQVVAFPGEVGLAAASMITGGTFAHLPNLRIAYSHGGGSLSMLLPRMQHAWSAISSVREALPVEPAAAAKRMYYDDLVYDAAAIRHLIAVFGASQIMVGSDYPFSIMDPDPAMRLKSLELAPHIVRQLRSENARRWLGLNE